MTEDALRCLARRVRRPGRAVPPDGLPALPTLSRAVNDDVGDGLALLATRMSPIFLLDTAIARSSPPLCLLANA